MVFYSINKLFNLIHLPSYLPIYQQTSQNWSLDTSSKELITEEACGVLYSKLSSISIRPYNPGLAENTFTSPRVEISYLDSQRQHNISYKSHQLKTTTRKQLPNLDNIIRINLQLIPIRQMHFKPNSLTNYFNLIHS